jgi:peptide/nickel transport system ATP-binding protein
VGEAGCGESVTALSILRLVRAPGKIMDGAIHFNGINLLELTEKEMRKYRGKEITMIFQDPLNSLNPVIKVGDQLAEVFLLHQEELLKEILDNRKLERVNKKQEYKELQTKLRNAKGKGEEQVRLTADEVEEIKTRIQILKDESKHIPTLKDVVVDNSDNILKEVGIADSRGILARYPHELSGGMRQRVMIAMALSCNPLLLIADEPTTALDVTIQAQILDLMKDLKKRFKTSIMIITHDLGIIAEMCDRVAVMYSGNIVEYATVHDLYKNPRHPYTKGLIGAIPSIEKRNQKLKVIRGMVPNLIYPPSGCRFHPRCDYRLEVCEKINPEMTEIDKNYYVACHLYNPEYKDSPQYTWTEEEKEIAGRI